MRCLQCTRICLLDPSFESLETTRLYMYFMMDHRDTRSTIQNVGDYKCFSFHKKKVTNVANTFHRNDDISQKCTKFFLLFIMITFYYETNKTLLRTTTPHSSFLPNPTNSIRSLLCNDTIPFHSSFPLTRLHRAYENCNWFCWHDFNWS